MVTILLLLLFCYYLISLCFKNNSYTTQRLCTVYEMCVMRPSVVYIHREQLLVYHVHIYVL